MERGVRIFGIVTRLCLDYGLKGPLQCPLRTSFLPKCVWFVHVLCLAKTKLHLRTLTHTQLYVQVKDTDMRGAFLQGEGVHVYFACPLDMYVTVFKLSYVHTVPCMIVSSD